MTSSALSAHAGQFFEAESAGVDRHAEGGVDIEALKFADLFEGRDAAGRGELVRGGPAQPSEPVEVGALEHPFLIHISAQEPAAVGLEQSENFFGAERGRLPPSLDHDLTVFRIEGHDDALAADRGGQGLEKLGAHAGWAEGRRAYDHLARALSYEGPPALDCAHASADARHSPRGQELDDGVVRAAADGGVEIDHLDFRERREPPQHLFGRRAVERLVATLDELHYLAVHQVDAGQNHGMLRTGTPPAARYCFRSATV